jgi:GxxExxY protein
MNPEATATVIVDTAIAVHRALGPGLLESAYQKSFAHALRKRGRWVETEVVLPIVYDGEYIDSGYRIDTRVDRCILVEHKAVEHILLHIGFLLNWNVKLMKDGIQRMVL